MSLYGSIKEVQSTTEKFYLKLEQRFSGNKLISELWGQMAQDVSRQIVNLHDLPKSFWPHLDKDQDKLLETIKTEIKPQNIENAADLSLSDCIEKSIRSEETIILKIYVPIIRNLRKNWTGQALDFYIIVKAHIVRIKRVAEAFSGDPVVLRHSAQLFQGFEKEIQEPEVEIVLKKKPARKSSSKGKKAENPKLKKQPASKPKPKLKKQPALKPTPKKLPKTKKKPASKPKLKPKKQPVLKPKPASRVKPKIEPKTKSKSKKSTKQSPSLASRSKIHRSRSKPLVEKTNLRRTRSRR